jgi:tRNA (guanine37-N1)-methyltransferase
LEEESFGTGLLEYPQYTRPEVFRGSAVPPVLLSGDHEKVRQWRREEALQRTTRRRPDLIGKLGRG